MLRIRDIMTRQVITLEPQMTLREAMEILSDQHVSGAPVVSGSRVVGVISAGDLLSFAAAPPPEEDRRTEPTLADEWEEPAELNEASDDGEDDASHAYFTEMWDEHIEDTDEVIETQGESTPDTMSNYLVEDVMSKTIRWLSPDADVRSAAEMMREYGVHRVLVCNRGRLVGLVSAIDIAKAVASRKLSNHIYVLDKTP